MTATYPIVPGVTFKDIDGFPGYCVGDDGSVWSCKTRKGSKTSEGVWWIENPDGWTRRRLALSKFGYLSIFLRNDAKLYRRFVHRLVLEAFVGPCPPGLEACHFPDATKTNNRLGNLRWDTRKANKADARLQGAIACGERAHKAKLTDDSVREIRALRSRGLTATAISEIYGVTNATICKACSGATWKHVQ